MTRHDETLLKVTLTGLLAAVIALLVTHEVDEARVDARIEFLCEAHGIECTEIDP